MILDATRGSIARFVNHSCSPNCKMAKWTVQGVPRMALFAGDEGIMTGEELTYDYNFNPFSMKNIQECRCGSDNCRGVLGPKPKEAKEKELREAVNAIATGGKRKIQQLAEDAIEGVKNVTKKRKLELPSTNTIKNAMMRAQIGITSTLMPTVKAKLPQPKDKGKEKAKPVVEVEKEKKKSKAEDNKPKPKKSGAAKPKLPIGWVYTEDIEEPAPPVVRNIFATDPEALLRSEKRKRKQASEEVGSASKKRRTTTTSGGELLLERGNGRRSSGTAKDAVEVGAGLRTANADAEAKEVRDGESTPSSAPKPKKKNVKETIVMTIKGRRGHTPGTPGGKSIRVISDEEVEAEVEEEIE